MTERQRNSSRRICPIHLPALFARKHRVMRMSCRSTTVVILSTIAICWVSYVQIWKRTPRFYSDASSTQLYNGNPKTNAPLHATLTNSQLRHFFDCNHPESLCVSFELESFAKRMDISLNETWGFSNNNLPAITSFTWWHDTVDQATTIGRENEFPSYIPANVSFVHMHKCGGSTIKATFQKLLKRMNHQQQQQRQALVNSFQYSFGPSTEQAKQENTRLRQQHIDSLFNDPSHVAFTVVRDPVERFLSAIQQVMHYHDDLRDQCLLQTAQATIQCVLEFIASKPASDVHLLPMVSHLRLLYKVQLKVFQLEHIDTLSDFFVGQSVHERDRSNVKIATSDILSKMTPLDCTKDMLLAICKLYAVDVAMIKSMGWETKYC